MGVGERTRRKTLEYSFWVMASQTINTARSTVGTSVPTQTPEIRQTVPSDSAWRSDSSGQDDLWWQELKSTLIKPSTFQLIPAISQDKASFWVWKLILESEGENHCRGHYHRAQGLCNSGDHRPSWPFAHPKFILRLEIRRSTGVYKKRQLHNTPSRRMNMNGVAPEPSFLYYRKGANFPTGQNGYGIEKP